MTQPIVPTAVKNTKSDSLADVTYFVVRVLRNALRNYPATPVSTEPEPVVRQAVEAAVQEIEEREGAAIPKLGNERLAEYIGALEHNLRSSLESHDLVDPAESVALLDDLRSESL